MKKEENTLPLWSDADHQINMRVDPLTTMDEIEMELREIEERREERQKLKEEQEREAKEKQERDKIIQELNEAEGEPPKDADIE